MQNYRLTIILVNGIFLLKLKNHIRKSLGGGESAGEGGGRDESAVTPGFKNYAPKTVKSKKNQLCACI